MNSPNPTSIYFNFHLLNFVIISGIFQSLILAGLLLFSKKGNKQANALLGIFILVTSLHLAWYMVMDTNLDQIFPPVYWFPYSYLLALGPLLYFYSRALTKTGAVFSAKDFSHFALLFFEIGMQAYIISISIRDQVLYYNVKGFFLIRIIQLLAVSFSLYHYLGKSLLLINQYEHTWPAHFSNHKEVTLQWLFRLLQYIRSLWLCWLAFEVIFLLFWKYQLHNIPIFLVLYLLLMILTYSTYWLGLQALIKGEILLEPSLPVIYPPEEEQSVYGRLTTQDRQQYSQMLQQVMNEEKLFLQPDLTLLILATRLNLDPNLVSYILNHCLKKTFYDFVNDYRIEAVKQKLKDPCYAHLKLLEIAFECGFNSKATFNRVFKKVTGCSPSVYQKGD